MRGVNVLMAVVVILGGCVLTGCAFIKPTTQLKAGIFGFEFYDTKDNDVVVKGAHFNPETKEFTVDELTVANKSSPVIEANIAQMMAFVEQQHAANEGIKAAFDGLAQMTGLITRMAETILPGSGLSVDTAIGGGKAHIGPPASQPVCPPQLE